MESFEKFVTKSINESQERTSSLTVTFDNIDESDLKELQKLFAVLNWSGSAGASRSIKFYVDGDGSFRAKIKMDPEPKEDDEDIKKAIDDFGDEKLSIGLGC